MTTRASDRGCGTSNVFQEVNNSPLKLLTQCDGDVVNKKTHQSQLCSHPPDIWVIKTHACIGTLTMVICPIKQFFNDAFPSSVCHSQLINGQQ
eukprot:scaffold5065_cov134-Skeletonema_marinoi.AAC.4